MQKYTAFTLNHAPATFYLRFSFLSVIAFFLCLSAATRKALITDMEPVLFSHNHINSRPENASLPNGISAGADTASNEAPTVAITSVTNGDLFIAPATIELRADAQDMDGTIDKVEFFQGDVLIATVTSFPYQYTWSEVTPGNYSVTARSTDNEGLSTTTAPVTISVNQAVVCTATGTIVREFWSPVSGKTVLDIPLNTPPTSVSQLTAFEAPAGSGDNYAQRLRGYICAPATGTYTFYIASDDNSELWLSTTDDPQNKVKIAFTNSWTGQREWTKYASQKSAPVNLEANKKYYIEALHKEGGGGDNLSVGWQVPGSSIIDVIPGSVLSPYFATRQVPTVTLTAPVNSASFMVPATIDLRAEAQDADGSIAKVEFFSGDVLIGTVTSLPYSYTWIGAAEGTHSLTAKATDNDGLTKTSGAVSISVKNIPPCTASGTIAREFWSSVSGKTVADIPLNTPPTSVSQLTSFEAPAGAGDNYAQRLRGYICAPATGTYTFYIASDDNSELWLSTNNDPQNKAKIASVSGWTLVREWTKFASQKSVSITLQAGQNYYIEALHKEGSSSDHLSVGWKTPNATGVEVIPGSVLSPYFATKQAPTMTLTAPVAGSSFNLPSSVELRADAHDLDGSIAKVEFFSGDVLISTVTSFPYSYTWSGAAEGTHSLTAKATDNDGLTKLSDTVSISVTNIPPCRASGTLLRELWTEVSGSLVSAIPVDTLPTITSQLTSFEAPVNSNDNYGQRLRGYICAPATGPYTFYIASDDNSELWLSTTDDPQNKVKIAYTNSWTGQREWTKYASQKSVTLTLQQGQRYYVEALHKEGSGGDHLSVGWQKPGSATIEVVPGSVLSPYFAVTPNHSIVFSQSSQSAEAEQGSLQSLLEYIATTDSHPVAVQLVALNESGIVPTWLSVNGKLLDNIDYTTGSEISLNVNATNLQVGKYTAKIVASHPSYNSALLDLELTVKARAAGTPFSLKVNFQDSASKAPAGWLTDFGQPFALRTSTGQGVGYTYGWIKSSDKTPLDLRALSRKRTTPADTLLSTFLHMQAPTSPEGVWEAQVVNGNYDVTVSVGDGAYSDSKHSITVEGVPAILGFVPTASFLFKAATVSVTVADGLLTVDPGGGTNTKINYISIRPSTSKRPSVVLVNPENGSQNVSDIASISTSILNLPNGGINNKTLSSASVYLEEESTRIKIPANVNGTGGGDAITLVPKVPLKLNTSYVLIITDSVKDLSGASFIPYASTFTTGSVSSGSVANVKFTKVRLYNTAGNHSSLTIGPDGKLYALSIDGLIKRFVINSDGTLQDPELLYSLQDAYGPRQERLAVGLTFDPASTATNLIAYVTHSTFTFLNAPDGDGKLTRLSGDNLQQVQDLLIHLPRSAKDHLTNSVAFGPDGALYFTQGSNSAMGRADKTWSNREERLLSATVLRLDLQKLGSALPLDVKTEEVGGTYNPFAAGAPLTIYASGVRNAYDLLWHSNGELYVPTNGSAAGGNTPASVPGTLRPDGSPYNGPMVPELSNVQQTQKDFLFRVKQGGYYGHPNPMRGQYVMNGGNPTSAIDPAQVAGYPVGTLPDQNWRGYSFDFQMNKSPNGVIEYKSNHFGGTLKGKLLVVRYSQNDDIITLTPGGANKDIVSFTEGAAIQGFSGFYDPLDLTEDTSKGTIYVSEYGGSGAITLLRPVLESTPTTNFVTSVEKSVLTADSAKIIAAPGSELSLNEPPADIAFEKPRVYPNPVHQQFSVEFPPAYRGDYHLQFSDLAGRVYPLGKVHLKAGGSTVQVALTKQLFPPGIYFLRIVSENGKTDVSKLLLR